MHYTYVLSSEKDGRFDIGTAADLRFETISWNGTRIAPDAGVVQWQNISFPS